MYNLVVCGPHRPVWSLDILWSRVFRYFCLHWRRLSMLLGCLLQSMWCRNFWIIMGMVIFDPSGVHYSLLLNWAQGGAGAPYLLYIDPSSSGSEQAWTLLMVQAFDWWNNKRMAECRGLWIILKALLSCLGLCDDNSDSFYFIKVKPVVLKLETLKFELIHIYQTFSLLCLYLDQCTLTCFFCTCSFNPMKQMCCVYLVTCFVPETYFLFVSHHQVLSNRCCFWPYNGEEKSPIMHWKSALRSESIQVWITTFTFLQKVILQWFSGFQFVFPGNWMCLLSLKENQTPSFI